MKQNIKKFAVLKHFVAINNPHEIWPSKLSPKRTQHL